MNKGCKELNFFVATEMKIADAGKEVLFAVIDTMGKSMDEPEFNTCKELLGSALLNLNAEEDIISQEDFSKFLKLLESCEFENEEEEEGANLTETHAQEAAKALHGMILKDVQLLYSDNTLIGKACIFRTNEKEGVSKFRNLLFQHDGRMLISEEY